jgi:hypothetical protein
MPKTKKTHSADVINPADIAAATEFTATLFRGAGNWDRAEADTLPAIRAKARELEAAAGPNARKAIIHAMVNGRAIPVPAKFDAAAAPKAKEKIAGVVPPGRQEGRREAQGQEGREEGRPEQDRDRDQDAAQGQHARGHRQGYRVAG